VRDLEIKAYQKYVGDPLSPMVPLPPSQKLAKPVKYFQICKEL